MIHFKKFAMLCMAFFIAISFGLVACNCNAKSIDTSSSRAETLSEAANEVISEEMNEISSEVTNEMFGTSEAPKTSEVPETSEASETSEVPETSEPAEEELPAIPSITLGENAVEVTADKVFSGVKFTFLSKEAATYSIFTLDDNCRVSWHAINYVKYGSASIDETSVFDLEANETITLFVFTQNFQADTVVFTFAKGGPHSPSALTVGNNALVVKKADRQNSYIFTAPANGNYAITYSSVKLKTSTEYLPVNAYITYTVNGETKRLSSSPTLLTLTAGESVTFTAYATEDAFLYEDSTTFYLTITQVTVAGESVTVAIIDGAGALVFYASEAGTYSIIITDGAKVVQYNMEVWDFVEITSLEVDEACSINHLTVQSETLSEATITIVKAE